MQHSTCKTWEREVEQNRVKIPWSFHFCWRPDVICCTESPVSVFPPCPDPKCWAGQLSPCGSSFPFSCHIFIYLKTNNNLEIAISHRIHYNTQWIFLWNKVPDFHSSVSALTFYFYLFIRPIYKNSAVQSRLQISQTINETGFVVLFSHNYHICFCDVWYQ